MENTLIDTVAGTMNSEPRLKRGESLSGHGLHYNSRNEAGVHGGKRHGSGKNNKEYAQACSGSSSVKSR